MKGLPEYSSLSYLKRDNLKPMSKLVSTSGIRERLSSYSIRCSKVSITANTGNTGIVVIGGDNIVASNPPLPELPTRIGIPLSPGEKYDIEIDNVNKVWIDAEVSNEGVTFNYYTSFPPHFKFRQKIVIDSTKIEGDLTDFPVLVKLSKFNFDFDKTTRNGYDIRFTDDTGINVLRFERGRHNKLDQQGEYWVKIPFISSTINTEFYIYYTSIPSKDVSDPINVWDENTVARWSLKEDPAGTAPQIKDSTINANHGTTRELMTSADSVEGKIGRALDFDGANDYVEVPYSATLNPSVFTVEAWAKVTGGAGTWRSVITSRDITPNQGYIIYAGLNNFWQFWIGYGRRWGTIIGPAVVLNQWIHLVARYDGTEMSFYINGTLVGSLVATLSVNQLHPLRIGTGATERTPMFFFNGLIDETRISNIARSPAWIKASFHSGNDSLLVLGKKEVLL